VTALDAFAAATAAAYVDVELADDRPPGDLGLVLRGNKGFADGAAAVWAGIRQGGLKGLVDLARQGGGAVAVAPVGLAGLAAGLLRLWLGRPFGERGGLTLGLPTRLLKVGLGLRKLALQPLVLLAETLVLPAELLELVAQLLQLFDQEEWCRHRLTHLDRRHRCHRCLATPALPYLLLCNSLAPSARGR
jgi:hypothetical protein